MPFLPRLKSLAGTEQALLDLISPHSLVEGDWLPETARGQIQLDLWLETMSVLLRLFPGAGSHSYCRDFGDVSPLALETVFNRPIEELESLALRLRSILLPSLSATEEIAAAVREFMAS